MHINKKRKVDSSINDEASAIRRVVNQLDGI